MKKYVFCTHMFCYQDGKQEAQPPSVATHKFQEYTIKGLIENKVEFDVFNMPFMRMFPKSNQIRIKSSKTREFGVEGENIGYINLPVFNYVTSFIKLHKRLKTYIKCNQTYDICILIYNSHLPQSVAAWLIKHRFKNVTTCNIVADLYGKYGLTENKRSFSGWGRRAIDSLEDYFGKKHDAFVFLTEEMAKVFNINKRPYAIVEGLYEDKTDVSHNCNLDPQKIIFYAGAVREEYGIKHLLEAFSLIDDPLYKLWIAGYGDMSEVVKKYASEDRRVEYLGYLTQDEIMRRQGMATILINPREKKYEFVKYSFPSKTMECLASGKPLIAHKLPCIPSEYDDIIQYARGDSSVCLKEKIVEVCSMSPLERGAIGEHARKFIANEKSVEKQVKKMLVVTNGTC